MTVIDCIGAFIGGAIGAMMGGNPAFITVGILGVLYLSIGDAAAAPLIKHSIETTLFAPCICFSGNVAALAFAANIKKYPITGISLNRPLYSFRDGKLALIGGGFGVLGYLLLSLFRFWRLPVDTTALTVVLSALLVRFFFGRRLFLNPSVKASPLFQKKESVGLWVCHLLTAIFAAGAGAYLVRWTGNQSAAFYVSAALLLFMLIKPEFPVTHHITMTAGYAVLCSGSILWAIALGLVSQVLCLLFQAFYNTDATSHVDAPAFAITVMSFVIFTCFGMYGAT